MLTGRPSVRHESSVRKTWSAVCLRPLALISSSSSCCAPMLMRLMPQSRIAASFSWLKVWGMPSSVTSMPDGTSKTPRTMSINRAYWSAL